LSPFAASAGAPGVGNAGRRGRQVRDSVRRRARL